MRYSFRAVMAVAAALAVVLVNGTAASAAVERQAEPGIHVAANPAAGNVPAETLAALRRDLKVTTEQAKDRLVRADWASRLDVPLRQRLGKAYAGSWLTKDGQELVVAVTDRSLERVIRASGATPRLVPRSLAELSAIGDRLGGWANRTKRLPAEVAGWVVDPERNQVTVEFLPGGRASAEAFVAAAGIADSEVVYVATTQRYTKTSDVEGGDGIVLTPLGQNSGNFCSVGFAVTDSEGKAGFITAGHCALLMVEVYAAALGEHLGRVWTARFGEIHDEALVRTDPTARPVAAVNGYDGPGRLVTDGVEQLAGSPVCKSGATTRVTCGTIRSGSFWAPDGFGGAISNLRGSTMCSDGGDSGGAVISGNHAQGTTSWSNLAAKQCLPILNFLARTLYVPLQRSLDELNVSLRTVTLPPAPPPVPPVPSPAPTPHPNWTTGNRLWDGLGGAVQGRVASVSLGANHLQVFGRGTDNKLHTNVLAGGTWGGWQGLGDTLTDPPTVLARSGGIDVYYRGVDTRPYLRRWNGSAWEAPVKLGRGRCGGTDRRGVGPARSRDPVHSWLGRRGEVQLQRRQWVVRLARAGRRRQRVADGDRPYQRSRSGRVGGVRAVG